MNDIEWDSVERGRAVCRIVGAPIGMNVNRGPNIGDDGGRIRRDRGGRDVLVPRVVGRKELLPEERQREPILQALDAADAVAGRLCRTGNRGGASNEPPRQRRRHE